MGGGLMQLVAYGAQDVYLTGNPQITFWKVTYRRHTNFAMESIEQTFNGQADFGRRVQCTISRNGDLAYRTYLQVTLPEVDARNGNTVSESDVAGDADQNGGLVAPRWLDYPGEHLINMVEVEIGGQRIDKQYGDWMHIWNQLTLTAEAKRGYDQMVGHTTQLTYLANAFGDDPDRPCGSCNTAQTCEIRNSLPETTLYVPLQFWFCRNPGMALPLIALQYHEVKINLELRPIDECLWAVKAEDAAKEPDAGMPKVADTGSSNDMKVANAYKRTLVAASLYVDYIFLDTEERRRMAQNPHEYLIEQVQFTGDESIGSSANKIKLNFNHPVKELVWVVQPDCHVDYCSSTYGCEQSSSSSCEGCGCEGPLFAAHGAQPFNYTDAPDVLPNSVFNYVPLQPNDKAGNNHGFIGEPDNAYCDEILNGAYGLSDNKVSVACDQPEDNRTGSVSTALGIVGAQVALDRHCWGQNPVVTAKLQLNGQDRFSEREGTYFDLVQPYQHHTRNPDTGINVYSFALRPEEHQPSGTANFSRIDNATLQLVVSANTVTGSKTAKVRVYAVNYNVLRVMSGMGGLAYSN
jgi:hypothetical protein